MFYVPLLKLCYYVQLKYYQCQLFAESENVEGQSFRKLSDSFRICPTLQSTDQYGPKTSTLEPRDMLEISSLK